MKQNIKDTVPGQMMAFYTKEYPELWKSIATAHKEINAGLAFDQNRSSYGAVAKVVGDLLGPERIKQILDPEQRKQCLVQIEYLNFLVPTICALYNWNKTKNIYKFDKTMSEELSNTGFDGNIPVRALLKMPDWCVFVDASENPDCTHKYFFAFPDFDPSDGLGLLFLLPISKNNPNLCAPFAIHMEDITIEQSLERAIQLNEGLQGKTFSDDGGREIAKTKAMIVQMLHHVLYLCSEDPDISNPNPYSTRKAPVVKTFSPVPFVSQWNVGVRIGAKIVNSRSASQGVSQRDASGNRGRPRAHVRRAHWHHYWTGPMKEERTLIVKWLHPAIVNADDGDAMPAVIHEVEGVAK
jgi:hypothetical protein